MADEADGTQQEQAPEFRAITSQEELDRLIGPRLERERAKFADYDDLKAKASRFDEIEAANKTEVEQAREELSQAQAEVEKIPSKVTEALRAYLVKFNEIPEDDAELFLTATDPETLLRQVDRLTSRVDTKPRAPRPNAAQASGETTPQGDWLRQQLARS